jgi:hypothetical protein
LLKLKCCAASSKKRNASKEGSFLIMPPYFCPRSYPRKNNALKYIDIS